MSASIRSLPSAVSLSQSLEHSIEEYKAIVKSLSEKLKEVTIMNDKWQKYNDNREGYVGGLRKDLKETRKQLHDREKEVSETRARELQFEKTVKDQQTTIGNFSNLMDDLDEKEDRERALIMRVQELEGEVESLTRSQNRAQKNTDGVRLLQEQLEVCIDDFKTERKEKEQFKLEALTLRKKSTETDNILRDYQEKIAIIKSLEFPLLPRESRHHRPTNTQRKTSTHPKTQVAHHRPQAKSNSWSYPSFSGSIEADQAESRMRGSLSEGAIEVEGATEIQGATGGIPVKPLSELFPGHKTTEQLQPGSDSVFMEQSGDEELVRH